MKKRAQFVNGEYYHIYNRGVDKRAIFSDENDIRRFFKSMIEFNSIEPIGSIYEHSFKQKAKDVEGRLGGETPKSKEDGRKLVKFVAYCLNPNHYHFILKQVADGGISEFMKRLGGYTSYFNEKHKRSGALFQGVFKSVHIDSDEYLLHLSAYVNLNNRFGGGLGGETPKLSMSSWQEYIGVIPGGFCDTEIILDGFEDRKTYGEFALGSLEDIIERKKQEKELARVLIE